MHDRDSIYHLLILCSYITFFWAFTTTYTWLISRLIHPIINLDCLGPLITDYPAPFDINFWVIWIHVITIFALLRYNYITIHLFGNLPLQLFLYPIHAIFYTSNDTRPTCRSSQFSTFLYTPYIFILSLTCNLLSFLQHQSGAASNHVEGSPASNVGPSPPGPSPGSHAGASHPSQSSWAAFGDVKEGRSYCTAREGGNQNTFPLVLIKFHPQIL